MTEELNNESITLTDAADRHLADGKIVSHGPAVQHVDQNNEQEMYHCSVGQSTAFG